ncbi:SDR family NAD(P)-dependent oxidoreductase, partial [Nocardiopsis sediminis]
RCKAFAAAADGTAWAEGAGVLVLERLADARRNGRRILAVIRGTAVNQDGASSGMTAPSGPAQERVIRRALADARLEPGDVDAVEAHGTGTTLGDPIEARAVLATYGQGRPQGRPVRLGSLKSNIGHAGTAAGVAGVIKSVLALRNGVLPATLHVDRPSPHVDWSAGAVGLLTEPLPWPDTGRPRRVAVSSFGVSGTNAHAILEQAPAPDPASAAVPISADPVPDRAAQPGSVDAARTSRRAEPAREGIGAEKARAASAAAAPSPEPADPGTASGQADSAPEEGGADGAARPAAGRPGHAAATGNPRTREVPEPHGPAASEALGGPAGEPAVPHRARPDESGPAATGPEPAAPVLPLGPLPIAQPWLLSGRSEQALREQARRLADHVAAGDPPAGIAAALATTRTHFAHRAAVLPGADGPLTGLRAQAGGAGDTRVVVGNVLEGGTVFVFPGQGAQWAGMASGLLEASPVFRERIEECAEALAPHTDWSLPEVLRAGPGAPGLDRVDVVQPALFAVMVGLAEVWRACGVRPAAVVGHSQGEIAAACFAGALSLEDAARLVAVRSRLIAELAGTGAMTSVALPEEEAARMLERWGGRAGIAAVNGPSSVVLSGDSAALAEVEEACAARGVLARRVPVSFASHSPHVDALRAPMLEELSGLRPRRGEIAFHSSVSGEREDGTALDAGYWFANLRRPVLFAAAVRALHDRGYTAFIEVGAHPVAESGMRQTLAEQDGPAAVLTTLRRGEGGPDRFLSALAEAHVAGVEVDWAAVHGGPAVGVDLPTYAFEHRNYWLDASPAGAAAPRAGVGGADHPFLGAAVPVADTGGFLFTGLVSLRAHPWLADHAVLGSRLLPGTAFVELALLAGERTACPHIAELTLHAPLEPPERGGAQLQVAVGPPGDTGERTLHIHSRPHRASDDAGTDDVPWTHHATGVLAPAAALPEPEPEPEPDAAEGPLAEAVDIPVDDLYPRLAERGYHYGAAFRGLRAARRVGAAVVADIALPDTPAHPAGAPAFALHPALLDAAQHAMALLDADGDRDAALAEPRHAAATPGAAETTGVEVPFSWSGVTLHATGATRLRVRVTRLEGGGVSLSAADPAGMPVVTVESLVLRPAGGALRSARPRDDLFAVEWPPLRRQPSTAGKPPVWAVLGDVPPDMASALAAHGAIPYPDTAALSAAIASGAFAPDAVIAPFLPGAVGTAGAVGPTGAPGAPGPAGSDAAAPPPDAGFGTLADDAHEASRRTLTLLQAWLADEAPVPLVVLTSGAVAAVPGEGVRDLIHAPVWGLARSAQAEYPDRIVLLDADDPLDALPLIDTALATGEPQIAIRTGRLHTPRLARALPPTATSAGEDAERRPSAAGPGGFGGGTVVVTGAFGMVGGVVVRHLVEGCGVRRLLLLGRLGTASAGAAGLVDEVTALGARVDVAACDAADRGALWRVLDGVPADRPITAVVHAAGVVDDGVLASLTPERLDRVLRPKVDAALHLHEYTQDRDLAAFVLFSSAAGVFGTPGQANYAAANAFLDALAHHRRARGLPATCVAWGLWEQRSGLTAGLDDTDLARFSRMGIAAPIGTGQGRELFDTAVAGRDPHVLAVPLDLAGVRARSARTGGVPPLFRGLVRATRRR